MRTTRPDGRAASAGTDGNIEDVCVSAPFSSTALRLGIAAFFVSLLPCESFAKPDVSQLTAAPITVEARPVTRFSRTGLAAEPSGKIKFRGGLVLTSPSPSFGGFSGLVVDDEARSFLAISDTGVWMTGRIAYADDRPSAIENARLGPLLTPDGSPIKRSIARDSEAVTLETGTLQKGTVLVSFERQPRIVRYGVTADGLSPARGELPLPAGTRRMRRNQGLEALNVVKGGAARGSVLAFSERLYDSARDHTGWLMKGAAARTVHLKNVGDFDITDVASLDDGTLFVLERRFRWTEGVKMRLLRLQADALEANGTMDGEVLIEADLESEIDNMEGLSATRLKDGRVLLTLISDDNFNTLLQRTILLQFLVEDQKQAGNGQAR